MDETGGGYTSSDSDVDMNFHDENHHHHQQQQHHYQQQQLREDFTSWVHVHWWYSRVEEFVAVANTQHIQAERPEWMKLSNTEGTRLTAWQFIENVMELLAEVAGDRNDHTLAIGSFDHYASIFVRVGHIQTHPFIQECMQALPNDNKPLASFMRRNIGPRPCSFEYDETGGIDVIQILGRLSPNMRRVFA